MDDVIEALHGALKWLQQRQQQRCADTGFLIMLLEKRQLGIVHPHSSCLVVAAAQRVVGGMSCVFRLS
jgi:hypothetical protein